MTREIENYLKKYPEEVVQLFVTIRDVLFSIEDISVEERMWAKLPSYYCGEKFVRIIPFKDHVNIEAAGLARFAGEFEGCKFTPKGMLQVKTGQAVDPEALKAAFIETYR